jgi:hypothetical protein
VGRLENLPPEKGKRVNKEQEREGGKERQRKINQRMIRKREKIIYKNKKIPRHWRVMVVLFTCPQGSFDF